MTCRICDGSGLVAPSPFVDEPGDPWPQVVMTEAFLVRSRIFPLEGSSVLSGQLRPVRCPSGCAVHEGCDSPPASWPAVRLILDGLVEAE